MKWTEQEASLPLGKQEGFEKFHHEYEAAMRKVNAKVEILTSDFQVRNDYSPIHHIEKRLKRAESIEEKLTRLGCEVSIPSARENIKDIAGLRIICNFIEDVYQVADMLTAQDDIELVTCKDYIKNPKESGYKSYHMIVTVPIFLSDGVVDTKVEIQKPSSGAQGAGVPHRQEGSCSGRTPDQDSCHGFLGISGTSAQV